MKISSGSPAARSTKLSMVNDRAAITVEVISDGSFRTSVVDGGKYITTTSGGESWYAPLEGDNVANGETIFFENGAAGQGVIQGHVYEVRYTSSKNLGSFLTKPSYYSPRYYSPDLDDCITADGEITWDALVNGGYIIENPDGTYSYDMGRGLTYYTGLWENDMETFQDVVKDLPTVLTWLYRLTMLSNGKDFQGNSIDVNSRRYLELLEQVMDVEETVKYFAAHSFVVQMDNLFTWRQNYGLYVNQTGQSVMVPWDYDLAWGCDGEPADGGLF